MKKAMNINIQKFYIFFKNSIHAHLTCTKLLYAHYAWTL